MKKATHILVLNTYSYSQILGISEAERARNGVKQGDSGFFVNGTAWMHEDETTD